MRTRRLLCLLPGILLSLAACTPDYPFDKPGTWSIPPGSGGSNDANLRAMIVDPRDLTQGQAADGSEGSEAATPVHKVLNGQRAKLPDINGEPFGGGGAGASAPSGTTGASSLEQ